MAFTIAIFYGKKTKKRRAGWYWDDTEDHGGFENVQPQGPFGDYDAAKQNALDTEGAKQIAGFVDGVPAHYPRGWAD